MTSSKKIPPLRFDHFLTYEELTRFVEDLAGSRPEVVSLTSLGSSRDEREIHLLTITDSSTGAAEDKPAYLIHGNIHALELSGTHAALFTARQLVADRRRSDILKRIAFHIVPRINPDGAEFAVTTSGSVRSRTDRTDRQFRTVGKHGCFHQMRRIGMDRHMGVGHGRGLRPAHADPRVRGDGLALPGEQWIDVQLFDMGQLADQVRDTQQHVFDRPPVDGRHAAERSEKLGDPGAIDQAPCKHMQ